MGRFVVEPGRTGPEKEHLTTMRRTRALVALATALVAAAALVAPSASAAATFCHDIDVVVNGDAVIDESGCTEVPPEG